MTTPDRGQSEDELLADADRHVGDSHPELVGKISREDFPAVRGGVT